MILLLKIFSVVLVATLTALLLWYIQFKLEVKRNTIRYKDGRPVPGPPPDFPFGNTKQAKSYGSIARATKVWRKQYGNAFQFWLGSRSFLFLHDLTALKEASSTTSPFLSRFQTWAHNEIWNNKGIVVSNDVEHHKIHRAAALTRLMRTSYLRRIAEITSDKMDRLLEILDGKSSNKPFPVEVDVVMTTVTFDIIAQAAFSLDLQSVEGDGKYTTLYTKPFRAMLDGVTEMSRVPVAMKYILNHKWKAVMENKKKVDEFHKKILVDRWEEKKRGIVREDFMDYLVSENDPRTNTNFTEEEILSDIADLLAAGHETTSNTLCFALYFLAMNLDVQKELQEECDRFPSKLSYEDATKLTYTQGVVGIDKVVVLTLKIKETLRMQPTVEGIGRQTETRQEFKNFVIPEKNSLYFCIMEFAHDPDYFPEPEKFDPTRWQKSDEDSTTQAWFPFGVGARACIGNRMAMMEGKILLCKLMQKYSVRRISDVPMQIENAITSRPKGGLQLQFTPRAHSL